MSSLELKQHLISCQLLLGDGEKGMVGLPLLELGAQLPHHWPVSQPGRQRTKSQICPGSKKSPRHVFYTAAEFSQQTFTETYSVGLWWPLVCAQSSESQLCPWPGKDRGE